MNLAEWVFIMIALAFIAGLFIGIALTLLMSFPGKDEEGKKR